MTEAPERDEILARGRKTRSVRSGTDHVLPRGEVTVDFLPDPYVSSGEGDLSPEEQDHFALCEQAISQVQRALIGAGKALSVINSARLYREKYGTFETYVLDRWGMKRSHAYRLMAAWPIAVALSPIGDISEGQLRELIPVARRHGLDAAVAVYTELHQHTQGRVTAKRLHQAVRALPAGVSHPQEVRQVITRAVEAGAVGLDIPTQSTETVGPPEYTATRSVAALEEILAQQRLIYERLGDGLAAEALLAEPTRTEYLLREIRRFSRKVSHRAKPED